MNEEDKQLLLQALSAMLLYRVKINVPDLQSDQVFTLVGITKYHIIVEKDNGAKFDIPLNLDFKPYLRPMSSMTEEERNEYFSLKMQETERVALAEVERPEAVSEISDWLNSHYLDYRNLISKKLALKALKQMYKF